MAFVYLCWHVHTTNAISVIVVRSWYNMAADVTAFTQPVYCLYSRVHVQAVQPEMWLKDACPTSPLPLLVSPHISEMWFKVVRLPVCFVCWALGSALEVELNEITNPALASASDQPYRGRDLSCDAEGCKGILTRVSDMNTSSAHVVAHRLPRIL